MFNRSALFLLILFMHCGSCQLHQQQRSQLDAAPENLLPYQIEKVLPHDEKAYTQGLVFYNGKLYESTGGDNSGIAEVALLSGLQDKKVVIDKKYFGEGITVLNNKIYQLTWKHRKGFIYDAKTFRQSGSFRFPYEGWGITTDGTQLLVSDGSHRIYFLDSATLKINKKLEVREKGIKVNRLNELEYFGGFLWANRRGTSQLLKIDPASGQVVGRMDLSRLTEEVEKLSPLVHELNGIAYDPTTGLLYVTGKLWPRAYMLRITN